MTENKSYWLILILLSIIFGIIYSLHWLIPFLKYDYYIPINKFIISTGYDDNYFWYSHNSMIHFLLYYKKDNIYINFIFCYSQIIKFFLIYTLIYQVFEY